MSALIDILKKSSDTAPQPMGFRTARQAEARPSMTIIAAVKANGAEAVKKPAGADALLLKAVDPGLTTARLQKAAKSLKGTPWGIIYAESRSEAAELAEAGCDFIVFSPADRISAIPDDEKTGKILQVESSMDDGLLRAVNDLPADAVLVTDTLEAGSPLVWHQLMIYRHLAAFIAKPLLVPVTADINETELKALWDAGIEGIVVDTAGDDLKGLRELASKLPPRTRKRVKTDVRLPGGGVNMRINTPPDEEEED